jgi:dTDP-4-dehydrorhamnose 3,5-epimerase
MEGVEIKELSLYEDQRGWLGEIHRQDESGYEPAMSYLSMTKPGLVRGPHEHVDQTDLFCFMGKFRLYLWDNRKTSSTFQESRVIDTSGTPTIAVVPPGIVHAYKNMESHDAMVFNMPDRLYRGEGRTDPVDEVRYEDDPDSPYKIDD